LRWDVSGCIQRASDTFRIMNVHLAAQSLDDVGTAHIREFIAPIDEV